MLLELLENNTTVADMIKLLWWGVNSSTRGDDLNSTTCMHAETAAGAAK
jgi:hypothetical protein